ncbi:hypothetical protein GO491_11740 [Flavobacteriaceae bacterium Ap0902]|nr:hypothetical protein [Flavobacteriaceae bacterium Ap0902]
MINYEAFKTELCRKSLYKFVVEFWGEVVTEAMVDNWHIKFICDELQKVIDNVLNDKPKDYNLVINICPGTSKSTIVSIMAPAWIWANDPSKVVLCNTIDSGNANDFSQKFRDLILSDKYQRFYGVQIRRDSSAKRSIKNTKGGERRQFTTKSRKTGKHGDILLDDDQMSREDAISDDEAGNCIEGLKGYMTRVKSLEKVPYVLCMQRLSNIDTTAHIINTWKNVKHIVLPAFDNGLIKPKELSKNYVDGLLDPVRIPRKQLNEKKIELGKVSFNHEYGQNTESKEGLMYDLKKVSEMPQDGYLRFAFNDVADAGTDFDCTIDIKVKDNLVYVANVIYTQENTDVTTPLKIKKLKEWEPKQFWIEKNNMGAVIYRQILTKYPYTKGFNTSKNKDTKINARAEQVSRFFRFWDEAPDKDYAKFISHLEMYKRVGKNKHQDGADILSVAMEFLEKNKLINIFK